MAKAKEQDAAVSDGTQQTEPSDAAPAGNARAEAILRDNPGTVRVRTIGLVETNSGAVVTGGTSIDLPTAEALARREAGEVRLEDPALEAQFDQPVAATAADA
ncbi:hypothetical protein RADP37_05303 [Roseomonas mucosa]|uniref:Uncharacterized protein n=1 Tax=Roseomonas mucosa TaxID=207340 RepID=A0A4Y1MUU0_9PROT|nr:hypothetical protein [Roseomonas mucosa]AWV21717.1 hypothetical protein RADP37_05303 [Roseomonas mucosa]MDT8276705.1 hypothetical protein [Roseomonas mucosa]MDT8355247.1 hypothetical protein [Roseomonas mucosa]